MRESELYDKTKWTDKDKLEFITEGARLVVGAMLTVAVIYVFPVVVQVVGDSIKWIVLQF